MCEALVSAISGVWQHVYYMRVLSPICASEDFPSSRRISRSPKIAKTPRLLERVACSGEEHAAYPSRTGTGDPRTRARPPKV